MRSREFAGKLASQVFFQLMGVPQDAWDLVDNWVRTALDGHRATMLPQLRAKGGTTTFAMRAYFRALQEVRIKTAPNSILAGMQAATGCPASHVKMDADEAMNTAVHMALGGYLSTEFLDRNGHLQPASPSRPVATVAAREVADAAGHRRDAALRRTVPAGRSLGERQEREGRSHRS